MCSRFISNSVADRLFTGVATVLILGQVGDLTGFYSTYTNKVVQTVDLLLNLNQVNIPSLLTGLAAIAIIVLLSKTKLRNYSLAIALLLASIAVIVLNLDSVVVVGDDNQIAATIPLPTVPSLSMVGQLMMPAIAIGLLGLIQAAGISQTIPIPMVSIRIHRAIFGTRHFQHCFRSV